MPETIRIKPHHFLDILRDVGGGQRTFVPHHYGHAVHTVAEKVLSDRTIMLELVVGIDDICAPCRNNKDGVCVDTIDTSYRPQAPSSKQAWNRMTDLRLFERLGLEEGARWSTEAFCRIARDRLGDLHDIWREVPRSMTKDRGQKLMRGISIYLDESSEER